MKVNKIYNENCLVTMARMQDGFIDLTVTSPPYDNLRDYNGYSFDFESIAKELFRVTKEGGVVVWNVNVETMIWEKTGSGCLGSNKFYGQNFEFMFILTKGMPKTTNLICDRENKIKTGSVKVNGNLDKTGKGKYRTVKRKPFGKRTNIWKFDTQKKSKHPAPFPEQLANDHIISWSNENDLVYDCFMGSGTTAKMAILNNRNYIGSEISKEYCDIAERRIQQSK